MMRLSFPVSKMTHAATVGALDDVMLFNPKLIAQLDKRFLKHIREEAKNERKVGDKFLMDALSTPSISNHIERISNEAKKATLR